MSHFWMFIDGHSGDRNERPPFSFSFEGALGKHGYIISCEGALVRPHQLSDSRSEISINLGGQSSGGTSESDVAIKISPLNNRIVIIVPLTAVTGVYRRTSPDGLYLTTDPSLLYSPGMQPDRRALYSLLQFGALIPPLTPWAQVSRLIPGKVYSISDDDLSIDHGTSVPLCSSGNSSDHTLPVQRQCEELAAELDRTLQQLCPDRQPIILFSGGVDSGLLAARAAAMGWRQTLLVNCQFGQDDSESAHAEAMSRRLGLPFERILYSTDKLEDYFSRVGLRYPIPFGDFSAFPTFLLSEGIIDRHSDHQVAFDGTGGDGAFGLFRKAIWWRRISRLPGFAGEFAGFVYKAAKMWKRRDSRFGRLFRNLYLSTQMPSILASIAQNPLRDVAYQVPDDVCSETNELLIGWLEDCIPWAGDLSPHRFSMLDIILVCCGIFAQKDKAIFDASSIAIRYPFLEPNMVRLALERAIYWPGAKEVKSPLMNLLAQHVPREMVFRPKSGFTPPDHGAFSVSSFLESC